MARTALEPKPDYSRLSRAEINSLFALHKAGKSQTEIAQILGCAISTVHHWVHTLEDTTDLAKQKLRAGASDLVDRVLSQANVEESLEVLDRLDVAAKRREATISMTAIAIDVDTPLQLPTIDVSQVNERSNYQTLNPQLPCGKDT